MNGLDPAVLERGYSFAGEAVIIEQKPEEQFDVEDTTNLYAKLMGLWGMLGADPDKTIEDIHSNFQAMHENLAADKQPGDAKVKPFFAIDLPNDRNAFSAAIHVLNMQGRISDAPDISVYGPLFNELTPDELNRRSFAGETAIKGWSARAMLLGGVRSDEPGLYLTKLHVEDQIAGIKAMRDQYDQTHTGSTLAIMATLDLLVINAANREEGLPLLDSSTYSRIPQAGDPETGLKADIDGDLWVPLVYSYIQQSFLSKSDGHAGPDVGIRVSVGL